MSPNVNSFDISSLERLCWDLYHRCYLVSATSSDGFRILVTELASLHHVLRTFRDYVSTGSSFLEGQSGNQPSVLQHCLHRTFCSLRGLGELASELQPMGIGDGRTGQREGWDRQQGQIEDLKSRIMAHTADLQSFMTSIGSSSNQRLGGLMLETLASEPSPSLPTFFGPRASYSSPPRELRGNSEPVELDASTEPENLGAAKQHVMEQLDSIAEVQRGDSVSSGSRLSSYSNGSVYNHLTIRRSPSSPLRASTLPNVTALEPTHTGRSLVSPGLSFVGNMSNRYSPGPRSDYFSEPYTSPHSARPTSPASAFRGIHQLQLRDQQLRALRFERRDSLHQPDFTVSERFEYSFKDEEHMHRLSTRDWLRIAVWWLLKARVNIANCERPSLVSARGSTSPSTISTSTSNQAYVDLLKAAFILYDLVLARQDLQSLTIDENRKLISDLSEAIKEEFSQFISVDIPDTATICLHNLDICEPIQPDETSYSGDENPFILENVRYTTVELEDAGAEDERVILRTFVNAGIGGKKLRMRTKSAPYMLLLSTLQGESEPKITICNQTGTFCLQRDFTADDLSQLTRVSTSSLNGIPGAKLFEPITIHFDTVPVSISFQYTSDLDQFICIPKSHYDSVWQREPVDSENFSETIIFSNSVEAVEQLRAPAMKSMNPPMITRSCQVRVLERTFDEAWRSVRRIVISTSLAEKIPQCLEFFMPLSGIHVKRGDDMLSVQIKWSDTCQERSDKTDGSYNPLFTYVYNDTSPNTGLDVRFRSEQRAADFENAVLSLAQTPTFSWTQTTSSGKVYDLADVATCQKQYKAILLVENRLSFKFSSLHYLFRDTDYIYNSTNLRVNFPKIFYVDYISSHVEQLYPESSTTPVYFSHCEKKVAGAEIPFTDESVLHEFMSSLASGYELCFSRRADYMTTKKKQPFIGSNKSSKGEIEVQMWRRATSIRLACRWVSDGPDRWLTMPVPSGPGKPSNGIFHDTTTNRVEFPVTSYTRGAVLNLAAIASGSPKDAKSAKRSGPIGITFAKAKDREDFIAALDGSGKTKWKYGMS
ncbi:uncharacterized protein BDV14DRAFT_113561 [Aspergillus stella-maris]|uniref:uncharacterized protein n=1 Tax=Aspergillus stella-maris TaxID=1810926 RepID=UPI003CCC980D